MSLLPNANFIWNTSERLFFSRRRFHGSPDHFVNGPFEIFQPGGRDDDVITAAIDIFGDPKKTAAGIFFQCEDERFTFDLDFIRFECVLVNRRLRWPRTIRAIPMG